MGSKTRIYIVLDFVMGGELHDIVVSTLISASSYLIFFFCRIIYVAPYLLVCPKLYIYKYWTSPALCSTVVVFLCTAVW